MDMHLGDCPHKSPTDQELPCVEAYRKILPSPRRYRLPKTARRIKKLQLKQTAHLDSPRSPPTQARSKKVGSFLIEVVFTKFQFIH